MSKKLTSSKKKKSWKSELAEWGIFIAILGGIYLSGYHTEIIGRIQGLFLSTGLLQPDIEENITHSNDEAVYNMPLISLNGEKTSLADFKGKTIFLNFWATWCPPCIAGMPDIQNLYEEVNSDSISFVMVSLDENPQTARDFMIRKGFTLPVYFLQGRKPAVLNSTVVPTTYVISTDGEIVLEHRGMAKYNTKKFKRFLRELQQRDELN